MKAVLTSILTALIRTYQFFSRMTPRRCRYYPTCSHYALEAITRHGPVKGIGLASWRVLRCNPWSPGGYDPVPGGPVAPAAFPKGSEIEGPSG